jgi:DNA recombination protein RmuC
VCGLAVYLFLQRAKKPGDEESAGIGTLLQLMQQLQRDVNDRLFEQSKTLNDQLSKSQDGLREQFSLSRKMLQDTNSSTAKIVKEVTEKLTMLDETNKQVVGFAEQLQSLENILKNPKQRGVLGEYFLQTVLSNVLPPAGFEMQYKYKNGEIVDAMIFTREKNIPVDAKFSLENYNRMLQAETKEERDRMERLFKQDLKNRIDETGKYIRPEEGTLDFAFMFIPADGLYYDLLVQKVGSIANVSQGLIEYAFKKRVLIVSPTTLFAYLQTVLQGLRALKIEESAQEIQKNVATLQTHIKRYETYYSRLGSNLEKTVSSYNSASDELRKLDKDMLSITDDDTLTIETTQLSKPSGYSADSIK